MWRRGGHAAAGLCFAQLPNKGSYLSEKARAYEFDDASRPPAQKWSAERQDKSIVQKWRRWLQPAPAAADAAGAGRSAAGRESDSRPYFWEDMRDKYVPIFGPLQDDDEDAAGILSGFAATEAQIEAPLETLELDAAHGGGSVSILGVCHCARRSIERVREEAKGRSAVVLEVCEERAASVLGCPPPLRRRWFKAMIWDAAADPGVLWHDFAWDQLHVAAAEGGDMAAALEGSDGPQLVVLGDAPESAVESEDDAAREKLLAVACGAALRAGCSDVLCVVGADHVEGVKAELRAGACSKSETLEVECEEVTAKAWFLGPRALGKFRSLYSSLERTFEPEVIGTQRHEKTFKRKQGEELRAFEDLTELSDSHGGRTPPGTFIRSLQVQGLACCPATLEELQSWCGKEMGKL